MTCYLLKWNPEEWPKEKFQEYFDDYECGKHLRWSCGNTKKIIEGDNFYLIKNGKGGKGIIGSGVILSAPYEDTHYNASKAKVGKDALFVDVKFEYLVKPDGTIPVHRSELDAHHLSSNVWDTQGSGKTIPDGVAEELDLLWRTRVEVQDFRSPDELDEANQSFYEGASKLISVNAYERNAEARRKCLNKWGYNCSACRLNFELYYGPLGKRYMHVHHLRPLSTVKTTHDVDPVNDLRPVCPNCHAMLHRRSPPLSIEELQDVINTYGSRK